MRRLRNSQDAGFTLIEVMVSLLILGIVSAAVTPLILSGIKATQVARYNTQAKNLLQQRIDVLRNLQYHVPFSAGSEYVDLLDTYFSDAVGTTTKNCTSVSYSAGVYTCMDPLLPKRASTADLPPSFHESVAARFVDQNGNTVTPPAGYDSQSTSGLDLPPSATVALTVTVTWVSNGAQKSYISSTYRSDLAPSRGLTLSRLRTAALTVDTAVDDLPVPTTQHVATGLVSSDTGLSVGATSRAVVQGASASYSSGEISSGAPQGLLDAPDDQPTFSTLTGTASTGVMCGTTACFGPTSVANVTGAANGGLPQFATPAAPAAGVLSRSSTPLIISNVPVGTTQNRLTALGVQSAAAPPTASAPTPLVRQAQGPATGFAVTCDVPGTAAGAVNFATSTGYARTTAGSGHAVDACTTTTTQTIDLFPTSFAPLGVMRVSVDYASARCVAGLSSTASALYQVSVTYWTGSSYATPVVLKNGSGASLPSNLLTRGNGGVQVWTNPATNAPVWLGDYFTAVNGPQVSTATPTGSAQVSIKALSVATVPTRDADTTGVSALNVVFGDLTCTAQDTRQ